MNKILSFILVAVLMLGLFTFAAYAEGEVPVQLTADADSTLAVGESFTVAVSFGGDNAIAVVDAQVNYDANVLRLDSVDFTYDALQAEYGAQGGTRPGALIWVSADPVVISGQFATLYFTAVGEPAGRSTQLSFTATNVAADPLGETELTVVSSPLSIALHAHDVANAIVIDSVEASCTNVGVIGTWTCPVCNKAFSDAKLTTLYTGTSTVVPAYGHNMDHVAKLNPTETEDGNIEYWVCRRCGNCFTTESGLLPTGLSSEIERSATVIAAIGTGDTPRYGDADENGKINSLDTARIMRYLAGYPVTINTVNADVTHDKKINSLDSARLQRYLAGWPVKLDP